MHIIGAQRYVMPTMQLLVLIVFSLLTRNFIYYSQTKTRLNPGVGLGLSSVTDDSVWVALCGEYTVCCSVVMLNNVYSCPEVLSSVTDDCVGTLVGR
jgi:hypothetical protein